jgi:hypothetical protein
VSGLQATSGRADVAALCLALPYSADRIVGITQINRGFDSHFLSPDRFGYRVNFNTRLEALYIWTTKKDTDTGHFATDSRAIDFRVKLAF